MTGNKPRGIVLQDRDHNSMRELSVLRIADREMLQLVGRFGSKNRANARLLALTRNGLLRRMFQGTEAGGKKALYSLSEKGAALVGVPQRAIHRRIDQMVIADFGIEHQMAVNRVYCTLKFRPIAAPGVRFGKWMSFVANITEAVALIPDGYVELETPAQPVAAFLEIDLGTESLRVWRQKIDHYLQYARSGEFSTQFARSQFRVLVIAHSERRMNSIRALVASRTEKLFWFASQDRIRTQGFWAPIWMRPKKDEVAGLFGESK